MPVLLLMIAVASASGGAPDLTGANAQSFKAHLGQIVSLRGKLAAGMQGPCLFGATAKDVTFYVIADVPHGSYTEPAAWSRLTNHQVRVTGRLKFRAFPRNTDPAYQVPPSYYYMVLQRTKLQRLKPK